LNKRCENVTRARACFTELAVDAAVAGGTLAGVLASLVVDDTRAVVLTRLRRLARVSYTITTTTTAISHRQMLRRTSYN